jgi:small subunit ribosomal protein S7
MFQKPTFSNSSNKESPKHNFIKNTKSTQDKKFDSKKGFSDDFNKISDKGKQLSPNKTFSKEKKNFTKNLNLNYKKSQTKTYNKGIKDSIKNSNLKSNQNHNKEKTNIFSKKVIPTSIHRTDLKDINNLNKSFHKNNVYNKGSTKNFRQKDRKVDKKATLNNVIFIDSKQPKILTKGKFSTSVIKSVNQKKSFNQQKKLSKITSDFKNNSSLNNKKHELTSIDILNKRTQFLDSLRKMNDKIKLKVFSKVMLKSKPKVLRRIRTRLKLKRKLAYFVSGKLKELKTKIFKKTRRKLKSVYNLFLGVLTKKGKKSTAKKILDTSLSNISLKGQIPLSIFFRKCLEKMSIPLEIKQVRRGKQFYTVPFIMRQKRQRFLTIKNLVFNLRQDKTSIPFHSKLSNELANIYLDRHSKVILQNKAVILDALKNKANRHYRW